MEINDIDGVNANQVVMCINCNYKDVAETWQRNKGRCPKCKSKAYLEFSNTKKKSGKKKRSKKK